MFAGVDERQFKSCVLLPDLIVSRSLSWQILNSVSRTVHQFRSVHKRNRQIRKVWHARLCSTFFDFFSTFLRLECSADYKKDQAVGLRLKFVRWCTTWCEGDELTSVPVCTGEQSWAEQTNCTQCPAGYACPSQTDPGQNTPCPEGSYSMEGVATCTTCPAGKQCPSTE